VLEVLGGDDTDSDGDAAPRAEEEAAEGAAGEAAEEDGEGGARSGSGARYQARALRQLTPAASAGGVADVCAVGEAACGLGEGWRQWPARLRRSWGGRCGSGVSLDGEDV
jgi:hypothetical protein